MPLSSSICQPVSTKITQEEIIAQLWNCGRQGDPRVQTDCTAYFRYYTHQCRIALQAYPSLEIRSHQDVINLADKILTHQRKGDIVEAWLLRDEGIGTSEKIEGTGKNDEVGKDERLEQASACFNLVARLMLMIEVGELKNTFSGRHPVSWEKRESIGNFMLAVFDPETLYGFEPEAERVEQGKFNRQFTARNLALVAGFRVELTTNLVDHLLFRESDKTVMIFHHATFLRHQLVYVESTCNRIMCR